MVLKFLLIGLKKHMNKRIVVSMTSYPFRITNVNKSIFFLLNKQTLKPDEIHLFLCEEEFKNKEYDLPQELLLTLEKKDFILHWVKKNTYVHKRHEIFKTTSDNDCVFLIDDDVKYNDDLLKITMEKHQEFPDSIICYNNYDLHKYFKKRIMYVYSDLGPGPHINKVRWLGQSMIPSVLYPKEVLSSENQKIRNECSPISDECWFQPWVVYKDISLYYLNFGWGTEINPKIKKDEGVCVYTRKKDKNGYTFRENWLNNVLNAYPQILKKYHDLFGYKNF